MNGKQPELPQFPETAWRGLFGDYRDLIADVSECPLPFHFANILAIVSAELGAKFCLEEGKASFLNFYIFCCGRTGTKKSTASDLAESYIKLANPDHVSLTSVSSAEGLIRTLQQHENLMLRYDEIKDLISTAGRNGQRIEPTLNAAFDLRRIQAIVKKRTESVTAVNYYLTLLINGTPVHVRIDLGESIFSGGLLNRFLVFAAEPTGRAIPIMGIPDGDKALKIAARIDALREAVIKAAPERRSGFVGFTPEAREIHSAWYIAHTLAQQKRRDLDADPLTRLDVYAKKIAAVYCLAETKPVTKNVEITAAQMQAALDVLAYCQASMSWVTRAWTGQKSIAAQGEALAEERIEAYLDEHGCANERVLYRNLHMSAHECTRVVDSLLRGGAINVGPGRPRMVHLLSKCMCFDYEDGEAE